MTKFKVPSSVRSNNISSIVEELKTLHDSLSKVEQDEFESIRGELDPVAIRLVSSELVNNADKTVKLLNSCCIANILRLYAPDAPYSPEQLSVRQCLHGVVIF